MGKRLARLVDARMRELKLSTRDVERKSGGLVSRTSVGDARNGKNKTFELGTLNAIASGLELSPTELVQAYKQDLADVTRVQAFALPEEAKMLSAAGRRALLAHLEWLLEQERQNTRTRPKRGRPVKDSDTEQPV